MVAIERDNLRLKGVLPKDYGRPALDKDRLGELVDLVSTIGLGDAANRSKDVLGRVYEYFLTQFASAEGNANFAWVQHFLHHLSAKGKAGFVLANGSMSSNQSGEGDIRKALIEADLVDCMVALPKQLF